VSENRLCLDHNLLVIKCFVFVFSYIFDHDLVFDQNVINNSAKYHATDKDEYLTYKQYY